ncbi:hypothetical protein BLOT_015133 [Blomia tropicalis]|nr:hypothetical protein BLOT_015133 [Blomia tropicalis]
MDDSTTTKVTTNVHQLQLFDDDVKLIECHILENISQSIRTSCPIRHSRCSQCSNMFLCSSFIYNDSCQYQNELRHKCDYRISNNDYRCNKHCRLRYQSLMSFNNENVLSENALQRSQHFYFVYNICAGTQKVWEPLICCYFVRFVPPHFIAIFDIEPYCISYTFCKILPKNVIDKLKENRLCYDTFTIDMIVEINIKVNKIYELKLDSEWMVNPTSMVVLRLNS